MQSRNSKETNARSTAQTPPSPAGTFKAALELERWAYPVPHQFPQVPMNTKASQLDHVWEIANKIKTCMLTTLSADRMRSRPMHAMPDREAGCLWFITDQRGAKDEEIKAAPDVCLAFADTGSNTYLSLTGRAEMLHDVAKIRELWSLQASQIEFSRTEKHFRHRKVR
jgi:general stress protein 26